MSEQPIDTAALRALTLDAQGKLNKWVNIETMSLLALLDDNERLRTAVREALAVHMVSGNWADEQIEAVNILKNALGDNKEKHE